jgi:hypothetical protein
MAHHLERTALRVLTDCAPDFTPVAVPHAVALIDRQHVAVPLAVAEPLAATPSAAELASLPETADSTG